jgi:hypothetical protein
MEIALLSWSRDGNSYLDLIFLKTVYIVDNPYLSQLGDYGRDMITKPTYLVGIVGSIELGLSSIIFLVAEKIMLIACLSLIISSYFSTYDFKVPLPRSDFEKSLIRMVLYPDLITSM